MNKTESEKIKILMNHHRTYQMFGIMPMNPFKPYSEGLLHDIKTMEQLRKWLREFDIEKEKLKKLNEIDDMMINFTIKDEHPIRFHHKNFPCEC